MMKDSKYYKKMRAKNRYNLDINSGVLTKLLISVIIVLSSLILTNLSSDVRNFYQKNVFQSNISFMNISKFYDKYIGNISNKNKKNDDEVLVSNTDDVNKTNMREVDGSYYLEVEMDYPVTFLASGIIVYNGDKDNFKNTVIVQGIDGVDIWYSNVNMTDYSLYDYVSKGKILGTVNGNELIITIMKDGKTIPYDEYFK